MCLKCTEDNLNSAYTIQLTKVFAKKKPPIASLKYGTQIFSKTDQWNVCNPNPSNLHVSWNLTSLFSTYSLWELYTCSEHLTTSKQHPELQIKNWQCSEGAVWHNHTKHFMMPQLICLASDQELQYGVRHTWKQHWHLKLLWRSHSLSVAWNPRTNFYQNSIRSVCLTPFLIDLYTVNLYTSCLSLRQHSVALTAFIQNYTVT